MKDITIHLPLPAYLRQWLTTALGDPVRFPPRSYENLLLQRVTCRGRGTTSLQLRPPGCVEIVLPDSGRRRPEYYYRLTRKSRGNLVTAIDNLFRLNLWHECRWLCGTRGELNNGLDEWCREHGIAVEHRDTVRKKFYRMRLEYEAHGIILGKKYKNHCHASGRFVPNTEKPENHV